MSDYRVQIRRPAGDKYLALQFLLHDVRSWLGSEGIDHDDLRWHEDGDVVVFFISDRDIALRLKLSVNV